MRRSARRFAGIGLWTACVLLNAPLARAAEPNDADRATARALAEEGKTALERYDYRTAEDRFARADALVHAPTLLLGLARAQAGLGKLVEAHESYMRIQREGVRPGSPPVFAKAQEDAAKEVGVVAARLAWVTIDVKPSAGADIVLDGAAIPMAAVGAKRPLNPGNHRVRAMAPGYQARDQTFSVTEGQRIAFTITLVPVPASQLPGTVETAEPSARAVGGGPVDAERDEGRAASKAPAVLTLVVGAAGLTTGAIAGGFAMHKHTQLERACPNGVCPSERQSDIDDLHALTTVSTAGFIVGAVGVSVGIVWLLATPSSEPSPRVAGYVGPGTAGIRGQF